MLKHSNIKKERKLKKKKSTSMHTCGKGREGRRGREDIILNLWILRSFNYFLLVCENPDRNPVFPIRKRLNGAS